MYVCMHAWMYVCNVRTYVRMYVYMYVFHGGIHNWILVWDFMGISLVNGIYGGFLQGGAPFDS